MQSIEPTCGREFEYEYEDEYEYDYGNDCEEGGLSPRTRYFAGIEAIDQSGQDHHDALGHLFTGANPIVRDKALRD